MKYINLPIPPLQRLSFYLATEEYIARHMPENEYFFMWQVEPSVIVGRNQLIETEVNCSYCKENRIKIFRRKSGGGCVYADLNNIMFSYIGPGGNVSFTFDKYIRLIVFSLQGLGINAIASGRNDILIDGKKVSGNAFYHLHDKSIVHGTMLYDTNMQHMVRSITPNDNKLISKGIQSVRQHITLLKDHISLDIETFKTYMRCKLCHSEITLQSDELRFIQEIEKEYMSDTFIYGKNPGYTFCNRQYIPGCGEMEIKLDIRNGYIKDAHLSGDYFPLTDIDRKLLKKIINLSYDRETVNTALSTIPIREIIKNLSQEQFINLLFKQ